MSPSLFEAFDLIEQLAAEGADPSVELLVGLGMARDEAEKALCLWRGGLAAGLSDGLAYLGEMGVDLEPDNW